MNPRERRESPVPIWQTSIIGGGRKGYAELQLHLHLFVYEALLSGYIHSILIVVETFSVGGNYVFTLANLGQTLHFNVSRKNHRLR